MKAVAPALCLWCVWIQAQVEWNLADEVSTACELLVIQAGDYNGDGHLDVATLGFDQSPTSVEVCIEVALGDGTGGLGQPILTDLGAAFDPGQIGSLGLVRLPNGGPDDLLLIERQGYSILRNNGLGRFNRGDTAPSISGASYAAWSADDLRGDGTLQIVLGYNDPGGVQIMRWSERSLRFQFSRTDGGLEGVRDLALADVNGDGRQDVLVHTRTELLLFPLTELGQLSQKYVLPRSNSSNFNATVAGGDFDDDGLADIAVPDGNGGIRLKFSQGTSIREEQTLREEGFGVTRVVDTGDYDQDGDIDVLFSDFVANNIAWNQEDGFVFQSLTLIGSPLVFGDFNGDGGQDIAAIDRSGKISLYLGPEGGENQPPEPPPADPTPPVFLNADNFWWTGPNLDCFFPDPASDGAAGELGYEIRLERNCDPLGDPIIIRPETWPYVLRSPDVPDEVRIRITRIRFQGDEISQRSDPWVVSPSPRQSDPQRWLFHLPRVAGGFESLLRFNNRHPLQRATIVLTAFSAAGSTLGAAEVAVEPGGTIYRSLYGVSGAFPGLEDQISHLGIADNAGNQTAVAVQIKGISSRFSTWVDETRISNGESSGQRFLMEARSGDAYVDGIALLNLTQTDPIRVWAIQLNADDDFMGEAELGEIPPGGKLLSILTNHFPFVEGARYVLETREPGQQFQVLGMTFFEGTFFAPVAVQRP